MRSNTAMDTTWPTPSADGNQLAHTLINYNKICSQSTHWLNDFYKLMLNERTRYRTFLTPHHWPHLFITAHELANAGFFYTSHGDRVECAFCRGVISHWKSGDRALSEHSIRFPLCPFIKGTDVGNVPTDRDPMGEYNRRYHLYDVSPGDEFPELMEEQQTNCFNGNDSDEETADALRIRAVNEWMDTEMVREMIAGKVATIDQFKAVFNKRWHEVRQPYTQFAHLFEAVTLHNQSSD